MEQLVILGVIVVLIGLFIIMAGSTLGAGRGETKFAVGGFIGPIPFGLANERNMLYLVIAIAVIMFLVFLLAGRKLV